MQEKVLMKGNEALAEAAILAGCRHYFGYPITPQTEVAAYMSKKMPKIGSEVGTPEGKAIVAAVNMLRLEVKVKMDDKNGGWIYKDYPVEDVRFKKSAQPEKDDSDDAED